jgi:hypothetical protein
MGERLVAPPAKANEVRTEPDTNVCACLHACVQKDTALVRIISSWKASWCHAGKAARATPHSWHHPVMGSGFQVPGLGFRFTGLAECQKSWHHQTGTRRHHANLQL